MEKGEGSRSSLGAMISGLVVMGAFQLSLAALPQPAVQDSIRDAFVPVVPDTNNYDSYLGQRMKVNAIDRMINHYNKYKLVDALLMAFEHRPGAQSWAGEHPCKYLHALSTAWLYSRAPELKAKMDSVASRLIKAQLASGYSGTYIPGYYWTDWDVWVHKYFLIGLETYYRATGDTSAIGACKRAGNLLCATFGPAPLRNLSQSSSEHMGMPSTSVLEPMVMLYRLTGDPKYLNFAKYDISQLDGTASAPIVADLESGKAVNQIANSKAYEMLSNIVGVMDYYRMTGLPRYLDAVQRAWTDISTKRHYISGTSSWGEGFAGDYDLEADYSVGESCVTTTWLQLNWHLFRLTGDAKYADEIERIVYNALIAAQRPKKGLNTYLADTCIGDLCYFTPLIGPKEYGRYCHVVADITCCSSSQIRGIALVSQMMLGVSNNRPTIVLYTPAKATLPINVNGTNMTVGVDIATRFPADGNVTVTLNPSTPANFTVHLRVPAWCTYYQVNALGKKYMGVKGTFLDIADNWKPGDQLQIYMYMSCQTLPGGTAQPLGSRYPGNVAVQRGPQILATDNSITSTVAPANWVGGLVFSVPVIQNGQAIRLNMVPYSDAGQDLENFTAYQNVLAIDTAKLPPVDPPQVSVVHSPTVVNASAFTCSRMNNNEFAITVNCAKSYSMAIHSLSGALVRSFRGSGPARYVWKGGPGGVYVVAAKIDGSQFTRRITVGR